MKGCLGLKAFGKEGESANSTFLKKKLKAKGLIKRLLLKPKSGNA